MPEPLSPQRLVCTSWCATNDCGECDVCLLRAEVERLQQDLEQEKANRTLADVVANNAEAERDKALEALRVAKNTLEEMPADQRLPEDDLVWQRWYHQCREAIRIAREALSGGEQ